MKRVIVIVLICSCFSACKNDSFFSEHDKTYLDSLVHFDSIVAVYSYLSPPIITSEEPLPDTYAIIDGDLYKDSTHYKWADSPEVIRKFCSEFPRLDTNLYGAWDTTTHFYKELLIVTAHKVHIVGWLLSNKDSLVGFDEGVYKVSKGQLEKAISVLDKRMIMKEIHKKDKGYYNLTDFYSKHYLNKQDTGRPDLMYVYIKEY